MGVRWYVVQSKHNNEFVAEQNLRNQGFIVFLPAYRDAVKKKKNNQVVSHSIVRPLYPSYLFTMFDVKEDRWASVKSTRGVKMIIGSNSETATPLPIGFVEDLINQCDQDCIFEMKNSRSEGVKILPGSSVRILAGNFNGLVAKVKSVNRKKIIVFLPLLSRQIEVSLPLNLVEPLAEVVSASLR